MGEDTYTCFVDFRKAFDTVDRELLWEKLMMYGITGNFLNCLKAMYQGYECSVEVNHQCTPYFSVDQGVKQGCLLSPSLFNLFINDVLSRLNVSGLGVDCGEMINISILAYADDLVLIAPDSSKLQTLLNKLNSWCVSNGITINPSKTKIIHFRSKHRPGSKVQFSCGDHLSEYCDEYKYLGFWMNEHLTLNTTLQKTSLASRRALACLIAKGKEIGGFHYDTFYYLYHALVAPVMDYSSCVWGYEQHSQLETVQNSALRYFLCVGKYHPISALHGDMGWVPDVYRHHFEAIKWWLRMRSYEDNRIAKKVYLWSMQLAEKGLKNWCWNIKKLTICMQIPEIYSLKEPKDFHLPSAMHDIKCKLVYIANESWAQKLNQPVQNTETGGKLRYYKLFKADPSPAGYVLAPLSPGQRWVLASLRAGCLPLAVETAWAVPFTKGSRA